MSPRDPYQVFLNNKIRLAKRTGIDVAIEDVNPALKPFNRKIVQWALAGGRRAIFASFGLHKTVTEIEIMRQIGIHDPCRRLIVLPLGVRQEFYSDAAAFFQEECAVDIKFVQSSEEVEGDAPIYLTNYESVREGKIDPTLFGAVSLDEADCLRSFGSKTFGEMLFGPMQLVKYRFVATATPSPNDFQELIAYSHFLGAMDIGEARTRFFKRNSEQADDLTLHQHKEEEFWLWIHSWAIFVSRPSDLGDSDDGYILPSLDVRWHEVESDHRAAGTTKRGQHKLLKDEAIGVVDAAREKRESLGARIAKMSALRAEDPGAHRLIWHDLEAERSAIEAAVPGVKTVYGSQRDEDKEAAINGFRDGTVAELAAKPVMLGGGCNFQRHCSWAIFLGIGFKFRDFIQAIHRLQRFGQEKTVRVDLITSEAERPVKAELLRKWRQHEALVATMTAIVRKHGLNSAALSIELSRSMGVERLEYRTDRAWLAKDDSVLHCRQMESDSVHMVLTSIPFSTQYEYTPAFEDFGHTDDEAHFFEQMDFLTPNLLRILKPGRVCAVHVKDRIMPGNMTGLKYPTVQPFHAHTMMHFIRHGFTYLGMITVTTDVVRENNQTYRLTWSEMVKDSTVKSVGMPEYILLFRKKPSLQDNGYADEPVSRTKADYSLARWQIDAHAYWRSSGDRLLSSEDVKGLNRRQLYRLFRSKSIEVYNYENHVEIAEVLEQDGVLPRDYALLPPHSWSPDVWSDVMRARTYNAAQSAKGREKHVCPFQLDVVKRLIERFTAPEEIVFDPFAGIGTAPVEAIAMGRIGWGCELNGGYWSDSVAFCKSAEAKLKIGTLFDAIELGEPEELEVPA